MPGNVKNRKAKWVKRFRKFHKWPAIIIAFIAILFASSGIVMNHRGIVSSIDIPRSILPSDYSYKNWNLAAVRGAENIGGDTSIVYGNIGAYKTMDDFLTFRDFNQGFPKRIDNRKIYSIKQFNKTIFIAGTHLGLYKRYSLDGEWKKINLPVEKERIADLEIKGDTLIVLTRHYLLKSTDLEDYQKIQLPHPINYERKMGMFNTLWELHSGELWGITGKLFVDLLGIVTIVLSITGLLHFFFPKLIRRRKKKEKPITVLTKTKRKNLRWHNVIGYVFVAFLIINTTAGIFLRPPLLIAIAKSKLGIIPFTHLDTPNPWFDKLRRVKWDEQNQQYIFSTSDGFFYADESLQRSLKPFPNQPPVSVMGCNVLEQVGANELIVGSFSGMYLWNHTTGLLVDYFTKQPYIKPEGMARPIAENMVAGLVVKNNGRPFWFDYNHGALGMTSAKKGMSSLNFPEMPKNIIDNSPMSLWNTALEIHTGRIFEHLLGTFYILYVPLAGLCLIIVLISGFLVWYLVFRRLG